MAGGMVGGGLCGNVSQLYNVAELGGMLSQGVTDVKFLYNSQKHFEQLATAFGVMKEWKAGVPRGSYQASGPVLLSAPPLLVCRLESRA